MKYLSLLLVLLVGCISQKNGLEQYQTEGYIFDQQHVIYGQDTIARLSSFELAYDNGKLVYEVTFIILKLDYNDRAGDIIKVMHERKPDWDIEVQIDYSQYLKN